MSKQTLNQKRKDPDLSSGSCYIDDPIVALSSAPGRGAVAIIRFSGKGSHALAIRLLHFATKKKVKPRTMYLTKLCNLSGEIIDEPLAVFFNAPASYTGEDAGEIHLHGSNYIIHETLEAMYHQGFRAARPGEFTQRAFLNGKMDLTAAEGIGELIAAQSHQQWFAARQLATGQLASTISSLRLQMISALAYLEARIDFPDEKEAQDVGLDEVFERVTRISSEISSLVGSYGSGQIAREGMAVTLVGAPNAGKSTLMNHLLDQERAIVTPMAGTTRDYLEEKCLIAGRLIRIIDTAGLRQTKDNIEMIGINAAMKLAKKADLILWLTSSEELHHPSQEHAPYLEQLDADKVMRVVTKCDLIDNTSQPLPPETIAISCHSGEGLKQLQEQIVARVDRQLAPLKEHEAFICAPRHLYALEQAQAALTNFFHAYKEGAYDECLGFELQEALRALSSIIGKVDNEDILDDIFKNFCLGK